MISFKQFKNGGMNCFKFLNHYEYFYLLAPVISNNFVSRSRRKNYILITGLIKNILIKNLSLHSRNNISA